MSINNVQFTRVTLSRVNDVVFDINANFQFNDSGLQIDDAVNPQEQEFFINMKSTGTAWLSSQINFPPSLNDPDPNPSIQRSVIIKFYDPVTNTYSPHKGKAKIQKSECPPPGGSTTLEDIQAESIESYESQIKSIDIVKNGINTSVTVETENINGGPTGYRIVSNTSHLISTTEGEVQTWAFAIQNNLSSDSNNTFSFDFDTIDFDRGLPILFYKEGTPIENVGHSDALIWF